MAASYLDNDVSLKAVPHLQADGHDVLATRDMRLYRAKDFEQLLVSAHQQRILLTHNQHDFELLHGAWLRWSGDWSVSPVHAGILLVQRKLDLAPLEIVSEVAQVLSRYSGLSSLLLLRHSRGWTPRN